MIAKIVTKWLIVLLVCLVFMPQAYAETDPDAKISDCIGKGKDCSSDTPLLDNPDSNKISDPETTMDPPKGLTAWDYIRTFLAFIFVIGLLVWLLRFLNKRNRNFDQTRLMTNLGGVSLGQHKSIQLVKMGNHYFVVGVGEDVQLLKEIEDPDEIADLLARYDQEGSEVQKGLISQVYQRFFAKSKSGDPVGEASDFSQLFSSKMEEIKADRKQQLDRMKGKGSDRDD
ncbi:flagellar biosynthetic protein FliO [Mammaliicoccus sciuri]|uniref:Flagellar protein FliO/FliZ n=1 Tax=Sporosarcina newyorkensis TaxID=759851 RepID=A0A1T4YE33_9BACL|nr:MULTISPECIES: flagellar biosynthetic protein FliO [Sporosarcina]MBY0222048.1 flagellar biosynthetic protein FliO [Sporosarcina aquimarina]SKA99950.1 flagellar protein FliO/FliZ [Sporosarcina newyorkensis]